MAKRPNNTPTDMLMYLLQTNKHSKNDKISTVKQVSKQSNFKNIYKYLVGSNYDKAAE